VTLEARAEAGWILPGRMSEALRRGGTFAGPGFLVAVGYVDPGNWGTDLAAGSQRGYQLLWVLVVAGVVAIFLQHLAAKVGIASGRDLAQLTSDMLGPRWRRPYWLLIEVAMLATHHLFRLFLILLTSPLVFRLWLRKVEPEPSG